MRGKRLSWVLGGGIALLALLAVLVTVPLKTEPWQSQPVDLHATHTATDAPGCATMALGGALESQRKTPLLNVLGLSQVSVALAEPVVKVGGETACPEDVVIVDGRVIVYTPQCAEPAVIDGDEPLDDFAEYAEPQSRCGGHGIGLTALVVDPALNEMTSYNSDSRFELGSSGVVAADRWCLASVFGVEYTTSNTSTFVNLDHVDGDLCIDLS